MHIILKCKHDMIVCVRYGIAKMNVLKKLNSNMALHMIGGIVILLIAFGIIVMHVGYACFTTAIKKEYDESTYHMAETAAATVNGDHLRDYLTGYQKKEYVDTKLYLDSYCKNMNVSLIYVIIPDRSDYGRFVSVFNPVNNEVDNSNYHEWELGHKRNTTNDEYRTKYKAICEEGSQFETVYRYKTTDGQNPHITTMVPVYNSNSAVAAILCMQRPIRELDEATRPYLITVVLTFLVLSALASVIANNYFKNQFVKPIRKASDEASRFAKENTRGEMLAGISRFDELARLGASIDKMEEDILKYVKNLTAVTAEKERMEAELNVAKTIQETSIPNTFPAFPERKEFDIYATMKPAREVGGDFFNFDLIDDDHLAIWIGDVSGKGVPAALYMIVSNVLTSDRVLTGGTPAQILSFVNNELCEHAGEDMFVTMWLGILEISTGRLTAANAGHEYPAVMTNGIFTLIEDRHGFVLGGMENMKYSDYEITLKHGDRLFVYTDGLPEAENADHKRLGTGKMLKALNRNPLGSPEEILHTVQSSVDEFVGSAEQFDDLTMLCLEYR